MMAAINHANNKVRPARAKYVVRTHPTTGYYAVFDPEGVLVGPWERREGAAITRMKQLQAMADKLAKRTTRPCMCCRHPFASEGIHNRLCDGCRKRPNGEGDPAQLGRVSGLRRSA